MENNNKSFEKTIAPVTEKNNGLKNKAEELKGQAADLREKAEELKSRADELKDKAEDIKVKIEVKPEPATEEIPILENIAKSPAWIRMESQIKWYEAKSRKNKKTHKVMQFFQITMAVSIPAIVHIDLPVIKWIISILGALIAILESVQYMNQYEAIWISHKEISQRLRREKFLFLSAAGPYQGQDESERLMHLAERVEELVSIGSAGKTIKPNKPAEGFR